MLGEVPLVNNNIIDHTCEMCVTWGFKQIITENLDAKNEGSTYFLNCCDS